MKLFRSQREYMATPAGAEPSDRFTHRLRRGHDDDFPDYSIVQPVRIDARVADAALLNRGPLGRQGGMRRRAVGSVPRPVSVNPRRFKTPAVSRCLQALPAAVVGFHAPRSTAV